MLVAVRKSLHPHVLVSVVKRRNLNVPIDSRRENIAHVPHIIVDKHDGLDIPRRVVQQGKQHDAFVLAGRHENAVQIACRLGLLQLQCHDFRGG
jgi:hypothetical protein